MHLSTRTCRRILPTHRNLPYEPDSFKAALNVVVAENGPSQSDGPNWVGRALKNVSTHTSVRPTGPLVADGGRISCYPPRCRHLQAGRWCGSGGSTKVLVRWDTGLSKVERFFPPRPRKGVAAERTCDKSPLERLAEQLTRCTVAAALEDAGYVPSRGCIERYAHRLTNASLVRASALRTSPLVFEKACSMELIGRRVRWQVLGLQPRFSISSHTREPLWAKRYRT